MMKNYIFGVHWKIWFLKGGGGGGGAWGEEGWSPNAHYDIHATC